jgi:hypothetical protein
MDFNVLRSSIPQTFLDFDFADDFEVTVCRGAEPLG